MGEPASVRVTLRSPRADEAEAIAELANRVAVGLGLTPDTATDDFERFWASPRFDLELDAVVAEAADGSLTGYGDLFAEGDRREKIWMDVRGEPARELLHDLERRAHARADGEPAYLRVSIAAAASAARAVLAEEGYRVVRYSARMVTELTDDVPGPSWPEGIGVRTFDRERDEQRVFIAQEETFSDMWEYEPQPIEEWRKWMYGARHDPDVWFLAETDDGDLAGICLCRTHDSADEDMGWISVLGVQRPWRRRGLALALLHHAFREFRARGRLRVGLGVDAESETGAVELYARAGMRSERRYETWEKER
jgi:mycothiol synthase